MSHRQKRWELLAKILKENKLRFFGNVLHTRRRSDILNSQLFIAKGMVEAFGCITIKFIWSPL